jgi:NAD+ synthase
MDDPGRQIVEWLRARVAAADARGLVVGLSGGLDSSVVARLCQIAMPAQVLAAILPCHSDPRDEADARALAEHFGIPTIRIDLQPVFDALIERVREGLAPLPIDPLEPSSHEGQDNRARLSVSNVKPRLRMTALYNIAESLDYLVIGTVNRSAIAVGQFTKHGDGAADLLPLGNLLKGDVRQLGTALGIPRRIVEKPAGAGLWVGQTDEDEMGFGYADLERYLVRGPDGVAPALALRLERTIRRHEHKRPAGPMPE